MSALSLESFGRFLRWYFHGIALTVAPQHAATPEAIREAVRRVLADERFRHAAQRLRAEILELPGPEDVVPILEHLVALPRLQRTCGGR